MLKHLKKVFIAVLAFVCTSALMTGCGENSGHKEQYLHIATGNTAGTYYPIGGAVSEILNQNIENMHSSVQTTSGSIANLKLLVDGTVELAIVQNDIAHYASTGTEMFKDENKHKFESLKGIASLYPESCQFVTLENSGIKSISDLKGKKVAVGAEGSGAEANAKQILEIYGLTYADIDPQYLSFSAGAKALKEGKVDAAFLTAGYPTAAVQDVATQAKIRILSLDDSHIKSLSDKYPFYTKTIIPKGTYNDFDEAVQTVSVMALLVSNDRVSADTGYQVTKAIFENLDTLKNAHSAIANFSKAKANEGMTLKVNEGSEKFYKEN